MPPSTTWSAITAPASASTSTVPGTPFLRSLLLGEPGSTLTGLAEVPGGSWTEHPNYNTNDTLRGMISSENRVFGQGASGAFVAYASGEPPSASYIVKSSILAKTLGTPSTLGDAGVYAKLSTTTETGILMYYNRTNASPRFELYVARSGTYVLVSTFTHTLSLDSRYDWNMRVEGSAHTVTVNNTDRMSVVTDAVPLAGRVGVRLFAFSTSTYNTGVHIGPVTAEPLSSVTTSYAGVPTWTRRGPASTSWSTLT